MDIESRAELRRQKEEAERQRLAQIDWSQIDWLIPEPNERTMEALLTDEMFDLIQVIYQGDTSHVLSLIPVEVVQYIITNYEDRSVIRDHSAEFIKYYRNNDLPIQRFVESFFREESQFRLVTDNLELLPEYNNDEYFQKMYGYADPDVMERALKVFTNVSDALKHQMVERYE